jgi:aspartate/methionine/tyrosine aminotransferase
MKPLAQGPKKMSGSGIREIVNIAVGMPDAIRLEVGEPNFPTPAHIVEGARQGVEQGFTKYTQSSGLLSLRELLAEKVSKVNGYRASASNINVGVGGVGIIYAAILATVEPGEEVLIPDPAWPNYEMSVLSRGAVSVRYPLFIEHSFIPRIEDLEPLVTERTKMLVINSPSNPTGSVFPRETIKALVAFAQKHDLYLLADEVYDQLIFEGEHVSPAIYDFDRVLSVYSFSKTYSMTGWRVGYGVANEELSELIMKLQEPLISCVSGVSQKAAEAALTGSQDCITEMRESYRERRDAVVSLLKERGNYVYTPSGAFYILIDVSQSGVDSRSFALSLLKDQRVAVAPGTAFGDVGSHLVRVSLATEKSQLVEGVSRLCDFIHVLADRNGDQAYAPTRATSREASR